MDIFLWTIAAALLLQLLFVIWNLRQLPALGGNGLGKAWLEGEGTGNGGLVQDVGKKRQGKMKVAEDEIGEIKPRLSVLIPARDEAMNISACLRSVLLEPSPHLEVLVLDDRSTDGTTEAAILAAAGDPRVRILPGAALPLGWLGKSHACHQLAEAARGEWWLFLDADARLSPTALSAAMDTALVQGQGLVTGFPLQETGTWLEKLIVPMMNFSIACHLPIRLVRQSADPKFVAAHGAFLLIAAESYRATGGHASFRSHLVDDMQLAGAVKKAGLPVTLADVRPHITMRMYQDAVGVWHGYKKNIFAGVGRNSLLLSTILTIYGLLYLIPPLFILLDIAAQGMQFTPVWLSQTFIPSLQGYLIGVCIKGVIDRGSAQAWWLSLFLPVSICLLSAIALASWLASFTGKGYEWKGRRYS